MTRRHPLLTVDGERRPGDDDDDDDDDDDGVTVPSWVGVVVSIHVSAPHPPGQRGAPLVPLEVAELVQGKGIVGDKRFSPRTKVANQITLVEEEALLAASTAAKLTLAPGESRRNVVTRGVALNHLVGRRFVVGAAVVQGIELCEPCGHLAKLTSEELRAALVHRGGLRCQIVTSGLCRAGDPIRLS